MPEEKKDPSEKPVKPVKVSPTGSHKTPPKTAGTSTPIDPNEEDDKRPDTEGLPGTKRTG